MPRFGTTAVSELGATGRDAIMSRETLAQRLRPYTMAGAGRRALRVKIGRTPRLDYRHASHLTNRG